MPLQIDTTLCDAHGQCVLLAPDLFDLGDTDDQATVTNPDPPAHQRGLAQAAVDACPTRAITLTDP